MLSLLDCTRSLKAAAALERLSLGLFSLEPGRLDCSNIRKRLA
jgi:hypothetical protein